jgi:hypothetical protein
MPRRYEGCRAILLAWFVTPRGLLIMPLRRREGRRAITMTAWRPGLAARNSMTRLPSPPVDLGAPRRPRNQQAVVIQDAAAAAGGRIQGYAAWEDSADLGGGNPGRPSAPQGNPPPQRTWEHRRVEQAVLIPDAEAGKF